MHDELLWSRSKIDEMNILCWAQLAFWSVGAYHHKLIWSLRIINYMLGDSHV
nr:MAG TPA: hypothetical protein [Caudoviricetes sp.]